MNKSIKGSISTASMQAIVSNEWMLVLKECNIYPFKVTIQSMAIALLLLSGCTPRSTSSSQHETASPLAAVPTPAATPVPSLPSSPVAAEAPANVPALPTTQPPEIDSIIVPGERVGAITHETSRQVLAELYGEAHLKDEDIAVGEGETEPGTVVNTGTNKTFTVIWTDNTRTTPASVTGFGADWKTPEGIGIGTSFQELEEKLGKFELYGFEWDYGGTVVLGETQLAKYDGVLTIRVQPADNVSETASKEYEAVLGDSLFPSTDPNFQKLGITVKELIVSLTPKG